MGYKPFDLTGKVALITGGNSGIGLGMAEAIAEAGGDVCIWGTNEEKNKKAEEILKGYGGKALALKCNVADEAEVEKVFADTVAALGQVDACFANAGVSGRGNHSFTDMTTEEWNRVMAVNLDGAFFTLRTASKYMMERGKGGSLVGTASLAAIEGSARAQHYAATKGGLISMIKSIAVAMGRYHVRANVILPGWIESAMTHDALQTEAMNDKVLKRVPIRRWGEKEDFGGLAVYLTSDASRYHTGDTLIIDGGYSIF